MISALAWIPRGAAKAEPEVAELTEAEIEAMQAAAAEGADDVPEVSRLRRRRSCHLVLQSFNCVLAGGVRHL